LSPRDANVKLFVKADKLTKCQPEKPRPISARSPAFNIEWGKYIKPVETFLTPWKGPRRGLVRSRIFTRGLRPDQKAALIAGKLDRFACDLWLIDASNFDASVRVEHLRGIHAVYRALVGSSSEFERLAHHTVKNNVTTSSGIKYSILGNRMSGDVDTAIGNSLISVLCLQAMALGFNLPKWDAVVDGDDCLFYVPRGSLTNRDIDSMMGELGFITECRKLNYQECLERVEFNRAQLVTDNGRLRLIRQPDRALATLGVTHRHLTTRTEYLRWLLGAARAEAYVSAGVPCVGPLCSSIERHLRGFKPLYDGSFVVKQGMFIDTRLLLPVATPTISGEMRSSYAVAFGVSVGDQVAFERSIDGHVQRILDGDPVYTVDAIASERHLWWSFPEARVVGTW